MTDRTDPNFVHLHNHTVYSLLDGLAQPAELAARAAELKQPAIALTDHGVMYGTVEFARACKDQSVKPIIGMEAYITEFGRPMTGRDKLADSGSHHLLLLAETQEGYNNLIQLSSLAQIEGFYHKPRIDADTLARYSTGIITTTGCMAGEVPSLLNTEHRSKPDLKRAKERMEWYLNVFGPERFFVEIQEHSIPALQMINQELLKLAKHYGLKPLVTNDAHYAGPNDAVTHDMLLCVQTNESLNSPKRMRMSDSSYYIRPLDEMQAALSYLNLPRQAFDNTLWIAERCQVEVESNEYHLPDIDIPDGYTYDSYLEELTWEGAKRLYGDTLSQQVKERLNHELSVIRTMGFSVYYLIVKDICDFAARENIWWNVRGSGAGSAVAYAVGITRAEPIRYGLIFERFLNPNRKSLPDFDLDFPDDSRERLINYTLHRYGEEHVAQIASFGTLKSRGAVKDIGRLLGFEPGYVNSLTKKIPPMAKTLQDALEEENEFKQAYDSDEDVRRIVDAAQKIEGVKRSLSIHPAAVIVTPRPVYEYVPMVKPPASAITPYVTQFEYPVLESLGLLKIDFLGLATLTVMQLACKLIEERHGIHYDLNNIPIEGEEAESAYRYLATGHTLGVFQVEGQKMQEILREMNPQELMHITATVALYRPGPMDYIPSFIDRMHKREPVEYRHPKMQTALASTFGVMVFQEQLMQMAMELAGYSGGDADDMRKAVSKKKEKDLKKHHEKFVEGCISFSGIDREVAETIFDDILKFANYGFNLCLTGDTLIYNPDTGTRNRLVDLYEGKAQAHHVLSVDDNLKIVKQPIKQIMMNGIKPVYRLRLKSGKTIGATDNHPFLAHEGWKALRDLSPGDHIATPRVTAQLSGSGSEDSDVYWDEIVSIKPLNEQPVYDIEVDGHHNFVANDIIVHNSHALDYAIITVQTAWLKANYPIEFMAALLTAVRGKPDDVIKYVTEASRMQLTVSTPNINVSTKHFGIDPDDQIVFALSSIKFLPEHGMDSIIAERANGPFKDLKDFCKRINIKPVIGQRGLEVLIWSGALDSLKPANHPDIYQWRHDLFYSIENIIKYSQSTHIYSESGQYSLFGEDAGMHLDIIPNPLPCERRNVLKLECDVLGLFVSGNPLQPYYYGLNERGYTKLFYLDELPDNAKVKTFGILNSIRKIITKTGKAMAFIELQDGPTKINVTLFAEAYMRYGQSLDEGQILIVAGRIDYSRGEMGLVADSVLAM